MFGLVAFATLFVYNIDRILGASPEDQHHQPSERHLWLERHRRLLFGVTTISALAMFGCALLLPWHIFLLLVPLGAISVAYGLPWIPWRGRWVRLKDIPGLKIVLIAVVWALATSTLPIAYRSALWSSPQTWVLMAQRAMFIFAITLPFDVRDWEKDQRANIMTLPHVLGLNGTKALAMVLLVGVSLLALWSHGMTQPVGWGITASALLTMGLIARLDRDRQELYFAGWMDGTMLLQCVGVLIALWCF